MAASEDGDHSETERVIGESRKIRDEGDEYTVNIPKAFIDKVGWEEGDQLNFVRLPGKDPDIIPPQK